MCLFPSLPFLLRQTVGSSQLRDTVDPAQIYQIEVPTQAQAGESQFPKLKSVQVFFQKIPKKTQHGKRKSFTLNEKDTVA